MFGADLGTNSPSIASGAANRFGRQAWRTSTPAPARPLPHAQGRYHLPCTFSLLVPMRMKPPKPQNPPSLSPASLILSHGHHRREIGKSHAVRLLNPSPGLFEKAAPDSQTRCLTTAIAIFLPVVMQRERGGHRYSCCCSRLSCPPSGLVRRGYASPFIARDIVGLALLVLWTCGLPCKIEHEKGGRTLCLVWSGETFCSRRTSSVGRGRT